MVFPQNFISIGLNKRQGTYTTEGRILRLGFWSGLKRVCLVELRFGLNDRRRNRVRKAVSSAFTGIDKYGKVHPHPTTVQMRFWMAFDRGFATQNTIVW
jgi:hypothetical protein